MVNLNITIEKKHLWLLALLILAVGFAVAQGVPGVSHDPAEITDLDDYIDQRIASTVPPGVTITTERVDPNAKVFIAGKHSAAQYGGTIYDLFVACGRGHECCEHAYRTYCVEVKKAPMAIMASVPTLCNVPSRVHCVFP